MLFIDYIQKMLDLQDVMVEKVAITDSLIEFFIEMPVTKHIFPSCKAKTSYIHGMGV